MKIYFWKHLANWYLFSILFSYWNCIQVKKKQSQFSSRSQWCSQDRLRAKVSCSVDTGLTFSFTLPPVPPSVSEKEIEKVKAQSTLLKEGIFFSSSFDSLSFLQFSDCFQFSYSQTLCKHIKILGYFHPLASFTIASTLSSFFFQQGEHFLNYYMLSDSMKDLFRQFYALVCLKGKGWRQTKFANVFSKPATAQEWVVSPRDDTKERQKLGSYVIVIPPDQ